MAAADPENDARLPDHLREVPVPLVLAAKIVGRPINTMWKHCNSGRLPATPFPAGKGQTHWQVKLGDLAEYTGKPLSAEWLQVVEDCLNWSPGEEVRRVA